jgi:adenylate cyclase
MDRGGSLPKIIISYRRRDSEAMTGRIFDRLVAHYGREAVFGDIDNIPPGIDFRAHIAEALAHSDILLAIIGPRWAGRSGRAGLAGIDHENDFVRAEIETVLRRGIPVIPVLLGDTKMPSADRVPDGLKDFVFRQAVRVDPGRDFEHHMHRLTSEIDQILGCRLQIAAAKAEIEPPRLGLPDKPSIAVLPFTNMSGDPEQEYFADGMVEDIITSLSRIRWLFVIARNSSFTYKGQLVDVKQVGRELGVRYVLEGSVRKAAGRVRLTAQLIDAASSAHLWADRFDGLLEGIFELQDEVALAVAGVIEPTLRAAEIRRSADRPTSDLTAYDLYLRALPLFRTWAKDAVLQALDLLGRAIERDPRYGPALALAGFCHSQLTAFSGSDDDTETSRRRGAALAQQALQVAGDDPNVLAHAAQTLNNCGEAGDSLIALIDHALALNPGSSFGWSSSGWIRLFAGQPDLAIEHFEVSLRLDPVTPSRPILMAGIGGAHFLARRFDEAATVLLASLQQLPSYPATYRCLAACYAYMGRLDDAREVIERLRAITPVVIPHTRLLRNAEHHELLLSGLRLAMGNAT